MASWNPAFMPNTTADIPAPLPTDEPVADTTKHANGIADDDGADFWGVDNGVGEGDAPTENDGSDSWFPDYGNHTTAPATADAQATTQISSETRPSDTVTVEGASDQTETGQITTKDVEAVEPAPTQPEAPEPAVEDTQATEAVSEDATTADIAPEHTEPTDAATEKADTDEPSDIASKHTSTMSFTRTIPHEPSWSDDGDPEWNLARADTDPFKFLPSSDRTNSFPPVPPLEQHEQHQEEQQEHHQEPQQQQEQHQTETYQEQSPIVQPQVAGFLCDDDEVEVHGDDGFFSQLSEAQNNGFEQTGAEDGNDSQQQYMGGDLGDKATEALDARFEEGVPLISHDGNTATQQENGKDLFGGEDGNDDDFFSQVQQQDASQTEHEPQPLERKSTMQVLGAMDMGSAQPSVETVEEQPEEEADAVAETHNDGQPETLTADEHTSESNKEQKPEETKPEGEDLDAKWKELFADDEEDTLSLLDDSTEASNENKEKEIDPAAFFGSDDEGFLSDSEEFPTMNTTQPSAPSVAGSNTTTTPTTRYMPQGQTSSLTGAANPYAPAPPPLTSAPSNPYFPAAPSTVAQTPVTPFGAPVSAPPPAGRFGYGAVPPPQIERKAESFVDKKGGYQSPYDLPMEVVKVKKRPSMATLNKPMTAPAVPPPPKSATHLPPPPATSVPPLSQPGVKPPPPSGGAKPKEKFFEELPVVTKARPASRHTMGTASPAQASPYGPPPTTGPPVASRPPVPGMPPAMGSAPNSPPTQHAEIPNLVAPPRVNPYASLPSSTSNLAPAVPAPATSRYSPAPPSGSQLSTPVPPAAASRYSPAPPASRPTSSGYTPTTSAPPVLPPVLPHQPRTSSPLAHFESRPLVAGHGESGLSEKRSSNSLYDLRLQRVPSLPPTQEVEEEGPMQGMVSPNQVPAVPHQTSPTASRHGALPHRSRRTPPPQSLTVQPVTSPQRATSSYQPAATAPSHDFAPPPRSQTQSPGQLYGNRNAKPIDPIPRPSSVTDTTSPRAALYSPITMQPSSTFPPIAAPTSRPRGNTQNFNLVPPTDGREHDPLQRWRGVPLISWGVGGTLVTMFPKDVPRYGMGSTAPMVIRSPGEVKIKSMKDIEPMEERLAKFPGPLKGKSKKKETITWLTNGIETLERTVPTNLSHQLSPSHEDKRTTERLLLWKILRVFVEHDGVLEGNPTVNQAVREILYPEASAIGGQPEFASALNPSGLGNSATTSLQADSVDSSAVEQIRNHLITGDSEKAVWAAVDKRLWGHAFLLANALNPDLYKRVAQEFVKNEVNSTGHNNESLAALYDVLSGNHEESVDELVPAHARAGLQLVAKDSTSGVSKDAMGGLDKWRETLSLILSNRTPDDARAINSLGNLLSGYGRAEAAHICFLFARSQTIFGGLDNPASNFVLVGSDHRRQAEQFAKEIEPLLLSEVYEYGQTLAGGTVPVSNPHLAAYKLQHAYALAEYGFRDKALQYCEAIMAAITAQTKRSPYYHPILEAYVDDLMKRLKQAPKEESNSWIPKPSMNKVSDSMWNRFNKFVAGDDNEDGAKGSPDGAGESGPFARIAGGTPTISRSPSANNLETFGAAIPSYGMPTVPTTNGPNMFSPPPTRTASRYAPGAPQPSTPNYNPYETNSPYAPRSSMERASGEYSRSSVEMPRQSLDSQRGYSHSQYAPNRTSSPAQPYTPYGTTPQEPSYIAPNMQPQPSLTSPAVATSGYQPFTPQNNVQANEEPANEPLSAPSTGYQPPSYGGYEPPSFTPYEAPATNNEDGESKENGDSNQASETVNTFEPPSYQPYSYEPPSYEPDTQPSKDEDESEEDKPKPKKKGPMYDDDDDDFPAVPKPAGKSKAEIDRENEEMVRRIAEEEAKRAAEAKAAKKGWGFTSWFGKKEAAAADANAASSPGKPIRAKLGEANSFYFDPEQKRWVNKNASPEDQAAKKATPPPPKGGIPRSSASSPAPPMGGSVPNTPGGGRASAPPTGPPRPSALMPSASENNISSGPPSAVGVGPPTPGGPPGSAGLLSPGMATAMQRTASSTSAPPPGGASKPLSSTSSIDDLLGAAGPRKRGEAKKPRKAARYVDVMQK